MTLTIGTVIILAVILILANKSGIRRGAHGNEVFGGVCFGIARHFGLTPALVRVLTVLFALVSGGGVVLLYILLCLVLNKD
ncbi:MAG TPA: PspC domain-containing protein [Candidatus Obscuribacter sp.]|nr:PspC domain-containing protein [Candidatus Obscuribacter sp.]MBK9277926.1 PspC domain-containing protein [Candidatus Obscuribacter sp.]MBL8082402.1 PspC domain-containing protein [Candidatus Obscuribacter sp.]HMW91128.1 PspC domain-containing protein [Candidatus Obscuribacter sp.]HMY02218.1 PspC domain-containing protein [Candidatus Obscuribacter sp.]